MKKILLIAVVVLLCITTDIKREDAQCMYDCQYVQGYSWDYCRKFCSY